MAQYFGSDTSAQENDLEVEDNDVEAEMPGSMADRGMRKRRGEENYLMAM